jgi:triacylglycerol lipase
MMRWAALAALFLAACGGEVHHLGDTGDVGGYDFVERIPDADDALEFEELEEEVEIGEVLDVAADVAEEIEEDLDVEGLQEVEDVDGDLSEDSGQAPLNAVEDLEVLEEDPLAPWQTVLLLSFAHDGLVGEKHVDRTRHFLPEIVGIFGGENAPPASRVALHVGPGCDQEPGAAVLLLHGTGSDAQQTWVSPSLLTAGLAPQLMEGGRCVFAVTFPHRFGDNVNQAIQLAAALQKAREITGLDAIDVVAHSKGGIAALAYVTGFAEARSLPYLGDVDRLFLIGVPMGGVDFSFRHPAFNYPAELYGLHMPSSWDEILEWGVWKDVYDESIYGGAFDGVLQLTRAWDETYPLSMLEQDWYTTYYGGKGFVSHSLGIGEAITLAGNFMDALRQRVTPPDLPVWVASGGNFTINGIPWETTGPSDGMVFTASAEDDLMLTDLQEIQHFPLASHWDLVSWPGVVSWLDPLL